MDAQTKKYLKKIIKEEIFKQFNQDSILLNEVSFNKITYDDIFTKKFIKDMFGEDFATNEISYYRERNNIDEEISDDEIEESEDFKKYIMNRLNEYYENAIFNIDNEIEWDNTNNYLKIYRVITISNIKDWINCLKTQCKRLGIYWSWDENAAEAHWGKHKNQVLISSVIKEEYVDWVTTIRANLHPNYSEEKEIRLFKNTPLKIVELKINGKEININAIKNKTFKS